MLRPAFLAALSFLVLVGTALAQESSDPSAPEEVPANNNLVYGQGTPTVTCAPTHYCALALQQGEAIKSFDQDDKKWSVSPTTYGAGQFATPVLILTPSTAGLASNLTVITDRRNYAIKLVSTANQWSATTAFSYPNP